MRLILGLGNPGREYEGSRHNVGFAVIGELSRRHGIAIDRDRHRARFGTGRIGTASVMLAMPLTFMNLSGEAARPLLAYHQMDATEMIVVHDEADLEPGLVRVKRGGGIAGHNGLRSIDSHVGPEYWRIRLGIGHPGDKALVHNYVLHNFPKADQVWLDPLLDACASAFPLMAEGQPEKFMTRVALLTQPPKPEKTEKTREDREAGGQAGPTPRCRPRRKTGTALVLKALHWSFQSPGSSGLGRFGGTAGGRRALRRQDLSGAVSYYGQNPRASSRRTCARVRPM
ncbi:MAG: aminoacyl-tRNA hydrolase, partial [Acidobacteria bacterium]|nr:aminoacyl-tRNA hydrolase [Acidobacteriota bacterium]